MVRVTCHNRRKNCGYTWEYRGHGIARCPKCRSASNPHNWQKFGRWKPDLLRKAKHHANAAKTSS